MLNSMSKFYVEKFNVKKGCVGNNLFNHYQQRQPYLSPKSWHLKSIDVQAFKLFDCDGDGNITAAELKSLIEKVRKIDKDLEFYIFLSDTHSWSSWPS